MIETHASVQAALAADRPVVALETAVLTHGLPREPRPDVPGDWRATADLSVPFHLAVVHAMVRAVREAGATPAVLGVLGGTLHIGLDGPELERLATSAAARKASASTLAADLAGGRDAGLTVSASLLACRRATPTPIRVFATGGIGGVHRGWTARPDISADLAELARTPVLVTCAGAKSILDVPATFEVLESLGVPVLGVATAAVPRFHAAGTDDLPVPRQVADGAAAAAVARLHWETLGRTQAVLALRPPPADLALDPTELKALIERAESEAGRAAGAEGGADRTPALLAALASASDGRTLAVNAGLLVANARLAAEAAVALT